MLRAWERVSDVSYERGTLMSEVPLFLMSEVPLYWRAERDTAAILVGLSRERVSDEVRALLRDRTHDDYCTHLL